MKDIEEIRHFITEEIYIIPEINSREHSYKLDPEKKDEHMVREPAQETFISGNTAGKVLIIADLPLSETHLGLLSKIMAAVNVNQQDLAFLPLSQVGLLTETTRFPKYILLFGDTPSLDLLPNVNYETLTSKDKVFLRSASLDILENSVADKKKLWAALQTIFLA
ncbi:MAG: DNA polymerase III subunit psi [Bacteroidota bacterium]